MLDTRDRMARVDGRFVHWVRGYEGTRYSLIFFSTAPESATPKAVPFADFVPSGAAQTPLACYVTERDRASFNCVIFKSAGAQRSDHPSVSDCAILAVPISIFLYWSSGPSK